MREDSSTRRERMVRSHIEARGIDDARVLDAFRRVQREAFLPPEMEEFAYQDAPLPIEKGQTISQPYIVALMTAALELRGGERVLEIGTGSGYAAAILGAIARDVYTVERHDELARTAKERLAEQGFTNVHVLHGDGTLGWPEHAPYDAIVVAAGGPRIPQALLDQLAPGGRLVLPVGTQRDLQELVRVRRAPDGRLSMESLGDVRFVPLIGAQGWDGARPGTRGAPWKPRRAERSETVAHLIRECCEPLDRLDDADGGAFLDRVGDARVVMIGESSHGTSEFYRLRARLTRLLIERKGFGCVAIEGDWPDAARVNAWVVPGAPGGGDWEPFARFPTWMWRNLETQAFVDWLRGWNLEAHARQGDRPPVGFYGLDLYSLFTSIRAVLDYLDRVDPDVARVARERYGCLTPWESDPAVYGRVVVSGRYKGCEEQAVAMLRDLLARRVEYARRDGDRFLDAAQNAQLVADAERYYRSMYYGRDESWNLRDRHMFATLEALLEHQGPGSKAVVWAHNSHVGDARATEFAARGQLDLGQLARERFGAGVYLVGLGTDSGTVAAAHDWDGPMRVMRVRPSHAGSHEELCHLTEVPAFHLALRHARRPEVVQELSTPRLRRAIGVIYRPQTELESHWFQSDVSREFDEWVWIDGTSAVQPVEPPHARHLPHGHPFATTP